MSKLDEIRSFLREEVVAAMYMTQDELDGDALFSSYGLESATLVKIVANVNREYSTDLSVKDVLPYQSINRAAGAIHEILAEATS